MIKGIPLRTSLAALHIAADTNVQPTFVLNYIIKT
jgi:hypothetical protein